MIYIYIYVYAFTVHIYTRDAGYLIPIPQEHSVDFHPSGRLDNPNRPSLHFHWEASLGPEEPLAGP